MQKGWQVKIELTFNKTAVSHCIIIEENFH